MKYTVSIDEAKRSITVTLADGTKGTARCCPTDHFNINTGIELALERAKIAKANAEKTKEAKPSPMATQMTVTMLAKQLEKALPKGQIIVAVGGGDHCLTEQGKEWLASIAGVSTKCDCKCHKADDEAYAKGYDEGYEEGYDDGYNDGYNEAENCPNEDYEEYYDAMQRIIAIIDDIETID